MKRILSVLCLLAVILSCTASAFAEGPDWTSAYRTVLDEALAKRNAENPGDFLAECSYCLYDIDKDGTPELLLKTGTCEADYMGRIFFFDGRRADESAEPSVRRLRMQRLNEIPRPAAVPVTRDRRGLFGFRRRYGKKTAQFTESP